MAVILLAAFHAACSDPLGTERGDMEANLAKWSALGIVSYEYDYQVYCFCVGPAVQPLKIEVREREVVGVTLKETGEPVDSSTVDIPYALEDFPTVEDLFERIRSTLEDGSEKQPDQLKVSYDADLGYPRSLFVDENFDIADEEFGFTASDLREH